MFTKGVHFLIATLSSSTVTLFLCAFVKYDELSSFWIASLCFLGYVITMNVFFEPTKKEEDYFLRNTLLKTLALGALTVGLEILSLARFSVVLLSSLFVISTWKILLCPFPDIPLLLTSFLFCMFCTPGTASFEGILPIIKGTVLTFTGSCVAIKISPSDSLRQERSSIAAVVLLGCVGFVHSYFLAASENQTYLLPLILGFFGFLVALTYKLIARFTLAKRFHFTAVSATFLFIGLICQEIILYRNYKMLMMIPSGILVYMVWRRGMHLFESKRSTFASGSNSSAEFFLEIRRDKRKQKFFLFFLLTILVMILELFYGTAVNSLGLISDAFHMMIDSISIAVGFFAAHASSWTPDMKTHSFGYSRYEVLGGFINGVLLLLISTHIVIESIERIIDPPEINARYMFSVSVIGLVVNIIGVIFFHDFHVHSHSHGSGSCCSEKVDRNMQGVFLHIVADLLGSVSVIISSIFVYLFNIWIADPICSVFSAVLIFISAIPLLMDTGKILLLSGPDSHKNFCELLKERIHASSFFSEVSLPKLWLHSTAPRELLVCLVDAKLKSSDNYFPARQSLHHLIKETISESLGITNVNIILHLE